MNKNVSAEIVTTPLSSDECVDLELIEALFFAYRDFTTDADRVLEKYGFGRAHHRVLHFVSRRPGMTVAVLLDTLQITKQSLARVLRELIDSGHIVQLPGEKDRRQRELYPSLNGQQLALELSACQTKRFEQAFTRVGPDQRALIKSFLHSMTGEAQ